MIVILALRHPTAACTRSTAFWIYRVRGFHVSMAMNDLCMIIGPFLGKQVTSKIAALAPHSIAVLIQLRIAHYGSHNANDSAQRTKSDRMCR